MRAPFRIPPKPFVPCKAGVANPERLAYMTA